MTEIYEGLRALGGKLNHLNCLTSESRPAVGTAEPGMLHHNEVWVGVSYVASANLIHYGILADDGALALEGIYTAWSTYERTWRDYDSNRWFNTPEAWSIYNANERRTESAYQCARGIWEVMKEAQKINELKSLNKY